MEKPYSQACENNKQAILTVIAEVFAGVDSVLEIGSGTGQHAVHFARSLAHLRWQPSDQPPYLPGIRAWCEEAALPNLAAPLVLNVTEPWPVATVPAVFSANTVHIMHWPEVEAFFHGLGEHLAAGGEFCLYGPFNYGGRYTSASNAEFDQWLKARDAGSGIRDIEAISALADASAMHLVDDHTMPANNRLLHFRKS